MIFSPSSLISVCLPFLLKLPPAITIGILFCGSSLILYFNTFSDSKVFITLKSPSSSLILSSSVFSISKRTSRIVLFPSNCSNCSVFSLKYLSFTFNSSSSTFLIFRKSSFVNPSKFCKANCSSNVSVP